MTTVYIYFQSTTARGFAVGDVWQAFAHAAFDRRSFTAFYGVNSDPTRLALPPGDYWVQLKLPHGELTKDLITVPEQVEPFEVVLSIPSTPKFDTSSSTLSVIDRVRVRTVDTVAHLPQPVPPPGNVAALPDATRRTRGIRPRETLPPPVVFALDSQSGVDSDGDRPLFENQVRPTNFSLYRVGGNFMGWPRRSFTPSSKGGARFVEPEHYFTPSLKYGTQVVPMVVVADGNDLVSELLPLGKVGAERTGRDIARGRFTRDLVIVKGRRNGVEMLATVPNGWRGDSAYLRIMANTADSGNPLSVTVEVKDPKFNALLQFMRGGDLNSAIRVIESSVEILYAKFNNPYAAAAAGYVLVQAAPGTMQVPWKMWIGNLGRYFKDLPDGEILHATLLLQRGDAQDWDAPDFELHARYFPHGAARRHELAAQLILSALGKGPPMFRPGLSLLASNLRILGSVELSTDVRVSLTEAEKLVTWLSMRVDPVEPFSVFHLRG
ncbi:hypothetical protein LPN04_31995 [Rugamonas sp. A1-17]|nr:hypothetical protein [Rugamonas sp. A1-17]